MGPTKSGSLELLYRCRILKGQVRNSMFSDVFCHKLLLVVGPRQQAAEADPGSPAVGSTEGHKLSDADLRLLPFVTGLADDLLRFFDFTLAHPPAGELPRVP
jgi:hypothetical protein